MRLVPRRFEELGPTLNSGSEPGDSGGSVPLGQGTIRAAVTGATAWDRLLGLSPGCGAWLAPGDLLSEAVDCMWPAVGLGAVCASPWHLEELAEG